MSKLIITQYTDPMCIWCYGLEPALRKVELLLGNDVEFHNIMGLLVGDVKEIIGDGPFAAMKYEQLRAQMTAHFHDAANRSGMPISAEHMKTHKAEDVTSLYMSLAYEAMKQHSEETANKYLRRMREAAHSDDMIAQRPEVLAELATEFGFDKDEFEKDILGEDARKALDIDLRISHADGVRSFPTMKIRYGDREVMVNGYMPYEQLKRIIEEVSEGKIELKDVEATPEAMAAFISKYKRVAAKELAVAFSLDDKSLNEAVDLLLASGLYEKQARGTSYFIVDTASLVCDPVTGTCHF